ncbi:MAG TPA: 2-isopropylmalate synthase [Candidatus Baltobacteraceae bacterium]
MHAIEIFDTTLRDGEQSPGATMTPAARLRIARMLDTSGVDTIEAGFPAASPTVARSVVQIAAVAKTARIAALARCLESDIDRAVEAVGAARRPRVHVFIATSPVHVEHKLRSTPERVLQQAVEAVRYARRFCDDVEFSAEDATRSDRAYLARIFSAAIAAGATTINVPDTVGYATPGEMELLVSYLFENVSGIEKAIVSVHTHDDLGMATANALAAVRAGARQIECTINGIGERAGNCALEEVVVALRTRRDAFGADVRFDATTIQTISRAVARATRMHVQKNKAIVGANAFAHESGIHQDGVLKAPSTYEIVDPRSVGGSSTLPLGRNSGRHAIFERVARLGITLDAETRARFEAAFVACAERQATVQDADLRRLATALTTPT